jgi:hypothetical protein
MSLESIRHEVMVKVTVWNGMVAARSMGRMRKQGVVCE